jgi:peptidoglycan/LPS O-acetylase OafA/YrhL
MPALREAVTRMPWLRVASPVGVLMAERESASAPPAREKFHGLDQLRGLLCVLVVVWHLNGWLGWGGDDLSLPLAVDLFFVLSGFVVAHAYLGRLEQGAMSGARLVRVRLIRFYPLYLLGFALGAMDVIGGMLAGRASDDAGWLSFWPNLFFLPVAPGVAPAFFPLNPPAWSLLAEFLINVVFAFAWTRLGLRTLGAVVGVGAIAVIACSFAYGGLEAGWGWSTWPALIARVSFGFPLGVLLYRLHQRGLRAPAISGLLLSSLLGVLLLTVRASGVAEAVFDAFVVVVCAPLVVWLGASARSGAVGAMAARFSARVSFAVYAIHYPLLLIVLGVDAKTVRLLGAHPLLDGAFLIGLTLCAAWVADAFYDRPLGALLSKTFVRKKPLGAGAIGAASAAD